MKKKKTELAMTSRREMEKHHMRDDEIIPLERTPSIPNVLINWKGSVQMQDWKRILSLQCRLVTTTIMAVSQLTNHHALSIWYEPEQEMHQSELDLDLDLTVNDIATCVQHLPPDTTGAKRDLREFSKYIEQVSREAGLRKTRASMSFVNLGITTIRRQHTSTRDPKKYQPIILYNSVTCPALDVEVTLQHGRYCIEITTNSLQIESTSAIPCRQSELCRSGNFSSSLIGGKR